MNYSSCMRKNSDIDVVILCGGKGTRLGRLTKNLPKPMLKIDGKPFLDFILDYFSSYGFKKFVLCAGYRSEKIKKYYKEKGGRKIVFSVEKKPLGTGGAILYARKLINSDRFFVANGDSFLKADLDSFLVSHTRRKALISIALSRINHRLDCGYVSLNKSRMITSFNEKSLGNKAKYFNSGVYIFDKKVFSYMPSGKFSLEYDFFPKLMKKKIYGFLVKQEPLDIGTPERLKKAHKIMLSKCEREN